MCGIASRCAEWSDFCPACQSQRGRLVAVFPPICAIFDKASAGSGRLPEMPQCTIGSTLRFAALHYEACLPAKTGTSGSNAPHTRPRPASGLSRSLSRATALRAVEGRGSSSLLQSSERSGSNLHSATPASPAGSPDHRLRSTRSPASGLPARAPALRRRGSPARFPAH